MYKLTLGIDKKPYRKAKENKINISRLLSNKLFNNPVYFEPPTYDISKVKLTLGIDKEIMVKARNQNINISKTLENILRKELPVTRMEFDRK